MLIGWSKGYYKGQEWLIKILTAVKRLIYLVLSITIICIFFIKKWNSIFHPQNGEQSFPSVLSYNFTLKCLCNKLLMRTMHIWWKPLISNIMETVTRHWLMCILFCLLHFKWHFIQCLSTQYLRHSHLWGRIQLTSFPNSVHAESTILQSADY